MGSSLALAEQAGSGGLARGGVLAGAGRGLTRGALATHLSRLGHVLTRLARALQLLLRLRLLVVTRVGTVAEHADRVYDLKFIWLDSRDLLALFAIASGGCVGLDACLLCR